MNRIFKQSELVFREFLGMNRKKLGLYRIDIHEYAKDADIKKYLEMQTKEKCKCCCKEQKQRATFSQSDVPHKYIIEV